MALTATANIAGLSVSNQPLSQEELREMHAYWRAANYLSVGQIYLYANPLLREPLKLEHVKLRLNGKLIEELLGLAPKGERRINRSFNNSPPLAWGCFGSRGFREICAIFWRP
jgi:XFP N-terminal domain